jgi:chromate transporter
VTRVGNTFLATGEGVRASRRVSPVELFLLFSRLGLSSFGGSVSAWTHRTFVQQQRLISETEFAAALALARILPGANIVNLAVVIGRRLRAGPGAAAAVLGLLLGPCLAVVAFALLYSRFAGAATLHALLEGVAAASVGLNIAMGLWTGYHIIRIRAGTASSHRALGGAGTVLVVAATFVLIGVLRLPMVPTILCIAPLSIAFAYVVPSRARSAGAADGG